MPDWRSWDYARWNDSLVQYCFSWKGEGEPPPVEYIPATPEELLHVVGDHTADPKAVAMRLVEVVQTKRKHHHRSLCGLRRVFPDWTPEHETPPPFFAPLWLTCLAAYGFPEVAGDFSSRVQAMCEGSQQQFQERPELWLEVAAWCRQGATAGTTRPLLLPRDLGHRTLIGHSFLLAFPERKDRLRLAEMLREADLVGYDEVPLPRLIAPLRAWQDKFSKEFREELHWFLGEYLAKNRDPGTSPFLRAIHQEAVNPAVDRRRRAGRRRHTTLFVTVDDAFYPYVACSKRWDPPEGLTTEKLDFEHDGYEYRVVARDESKEQALLSSVFSDCRFLGGNAARSVREGVVPLISDMGLQEFRVAIGAEIEGCSGALVRKDRIDAFQEVFSGRSYESVVEDWFEVESCDLYQLDDPPLGLEDVTVLQPTASAPRPRLEGGLRLMEGSYFNLEGYLPRVLAPGASEVVARVGSREALCRRIADEQDRHPWCLPDGFVDGDDAEVDVEARYESHIDGRSFQRSGHTSAKLVRHPVGIAFKCAPKGHYVRETCERTLKPFVSEGGAEIPFGICSEEPDRAADLLDHNPTIRWLGPGVGQITRQRTHGFPWLVVGPSKTPHFQILEEEPRAAPTPDGARAEGANAKRSSRAWRKSFTTKMQRFVVSADGYVPLKADEDAKRLLGRYRAMATGKAEAGPRCSTVGLDHSIFSHNLTIERENSRVRRLRDVLSVLGERRAGVGLREVHQHFGDALEVDDWLVLTHLVRAYAECGFVDILRQQQGRKFLVVPRRPRLVVHRNGPWFSATLTGLVPWKLCQKINAEVKCLGKSNIAAVAWRPGPTPLQALLPRFEAPSMEGLSALSSTFGFEAPRFLDWPVLREVPDHLRVSGDLQPGEPPPAYSLDRLWCWQHDRFERQPEDSGAHARVERRTYLNRAPIYAVYEVESDEPLGWSRSRTWALLEAYELAGKRPFSRDGTVLKSSGHSPLHLPLPIARLCALLGMELPGPSLVPEADSSGGSTPHSAAREVVDAYHYPLSESLFDLIPRLLSRWFAAKGD
jgi:hypothetical protein